jgi:hypothetical protein
MNLKCILWSALCSFALVILLLFELPKLVLYANSKADTASVRLYQLQTPPSPPLWTVLHILAASYITMYAVYRISRHLWDPIRYEESLYDMGHGSSWSETLFYCTHYHFLWTVILQVGKLSTLPLPLAISINSCLVILMYRSYIRNQPRSYLLILLIPILLTAIAEIREWIMCGA